MELRKFLGHPEAYTQRIRRHRYAARVRSGAPDAVRDDIVQEANLALLTSPSRPRSMDTAAGWLSTVTMRTIAHYFRAEAPKAKWLDREADVDALVDEGPANAEAAAGDWMVSSWLAEAVEDSPRDQETFELLLYKAATAKSYANVAADHGMAEKALIGRVVQFKKKYTPGAARAPPRGVVLAGARAGAHCWRCSVQSCPGVPAGGGEAAEGKADQPPSATLVRRRLPEPIAAHAVGGCPVPTRVAVASFTGTGPCASQAMLKPPTPYPRRHVAARRGWTAPPHGVAAGGRRNVPTALPAGRSALAGARNWSRHCLPSVPPMRAYRLVTVEALFLCGTVVACGDAASGVTRGGDGGGTQVTGESDAALAAHAHW